MTLRVGGLCEGYAGIFLGLAQVLDVEHAWYSEYEPPTPKHPKPAQAAAKVLTHRFPGVPNHGDLTTVDWSQVEPVDLLTFGWPCQPFSAAGKKLGAVDERAIWPDIATAIGVLRPRYLFAENVPGVVVRGELARVLGDLARLGFDAEWCCVRASNVGAPHRRERFFLTAANTANVGHERPRETRQRWSGDPDHRCPATNTEGVGWGEGRPEHARFVGGPGVAVPSDVATDTDSDSVREQPVPIAWGGGEAEPGHPVLDWAGYGPAIHRWERVLGRPAPNPTVLGQRGGRQLNPVFVEWMQGLPEGWVTAVPDLTRNQKLKVLGNGCVPQQVAGAARILLPLLLDSAEVAA